MSHSRLLIAIFGIFLTLPCLADSLNTYNTTRFIAKQHHTQKLYELYAILQAQQDIANESKWRALLHYEGQKSLINKSSSFFISPQGYKDPKAEYNAFIATILFDEVRAIPRSRKKSYNDDTSLLCQYPARLSLIANTLHGENRKKLIDYLKTKQCVGLQIFRESVDFDSLSLEFAGESNTMPQSAMGHIYLSANRKQSAIIDENTAASKAYVMSYFAADGLGWNPLSYIRIFIGGVKGYVVLMPAKVVREEYLDDEKRTLYNFALALSDDEKKLLRQHLWELKGKEIRYRFITYNCNTAIRKILGVANKAFDIHSKKPYQTPTEYLSLLHQQALIMPQKITPPPRKQAFIQTHGTNRVFDTKKNSRLSLSYTGFMPPNMPQISTLNHRLQFEFNPIYNDGRSIDSFYKEFMESKLMALSGGFDFNALRPYIDKFELLRLKSILDLPQARSFSKVINISFESNLYQPNGRGGFLKSPNISSHIMPTIEAGAGMGIYTAHTQWYILPRVGYRYDVIHNVYLGFEGGVNASFRLLNHDYKGMLNYTYFYDFMGNNRGYDGVAYAYFGVAAQKNLDIFMEAKYYHTWIQTPKIPYAATQLVQYNLGFAWSF